MKFKDGPDVIGKTKKEMNLDLKEIKNEENYY